MAPKRSKEISFLNNTPNIVQVFSPVPEKVARTTELPKVAKKVKDQDEPTLDPPMAFPDDNLAERLRSVQEREDDIEKDSRGTMYTKRSTHHEPVAKVQDALPSPISPAVKDSQRLSNTSTISVS